MSQEIEAHSVQHMKQLLKNLTWAALRNAYASIFIWIEVKK